MRIRTKIVVCVCLAAAIRAQSAGAAETMTGAGATFPQPLYAKWAEAYRRLTGIEVSYQGTGSGDGVKRIEAGAVAFGASDRPLAKDEIVARDLMQFPTLVGGIVPVVNLAGVDPGALVLSGPVLSGIYRGTIVVWDDPAIVRLNPLLVLPHQAITVVHRSDASGTTFVFTTYLQAVDNGWPAGVGTSVTWPVGLGAIGNDGIAALVGSASGSIGYVEYAVAKSANLAYASLINKEGRTVQPTPASFGAAAAHGAWIVGANFAENLVDQPGGASWPLTTASYVLVQKGHGALQSTRAALRFFEWGLSRGGSIVEDLDFVPLPPEAVARIETSWSLPASAPDAPSSAPGQGLTR